MNPRRAAVVAVTMTALSALLAGCAAEGLPTTQSPADQSARAGRDSVRRGSISNAWCNREVESDRPTAALRLIYAIAVLETASQKRPIPRAEA